MIELRLNSKGLPEEITKTADDGWVDATLLQAGKLPSLPNFILPLVNNYTKGQAVSQAVKLIPPSGQQWGLMNLNEKRQLLELA